MVLCGTYKITKIISFFFSSSTYHNFKTLKMHNMHIAYKLIALSVVFGLVLTSPAAKVTDPSFNDLAYEATKDIEEPQTVIADQYDGSRTLDIVDVVLKPEILSIGFKTVTKLAGLKTKALAIAVKAIKWIMSKSVFLAIGAMAVFAFCKFTDKCSLALVPAVYHQYIPAQVRDFVTPERLEEAQQFLYSAMQKYAEGAESENLI